MVQQAIVQGTSFRIHSWDFIWGVADDVLRDLHVRGKYRDVTLPMTVLRRLDAVSRAAPLWATGTPLTECPR